MLTYLTSILWLEISETEKDGQVGFHSNMREWVQKMEFSCKKTHPPPKKKKEVKKQIFFFLKSDCSWVIEGSVQLNREALFWVP